MGNFGGRIGADLLCNGKGHKEALGCQEVRALISIDLNDQMKNMASL